MSRRGEDDVRAQLVLMMVLLLACGCTRSPRLSFGLGSSQRATVLVTGKQSFVTVENEGPGVVEVEFESRPVGERATRSVAAGTATGGSIVAPSRIYLRTGSGAGARIQVRARNANGLAVEISPASEENR